MTRDVFGLAVAVSLLIAAPLDGAQTLHIAYGDRVERYDLDGNLLGGFDAPDPFNIAIDSTGATYISTVSASILKFDPAGNFLNGIVVPGSGFSTAGVGVDHLDRLYVGRNSGPTDAVFRYTPSGSLIDKVVDVPDFGAPFEIEFFEPGRMTLIDGPYLRQYDESGVELNTVGLSPSGRSFPLDIAADSAGKIYISTFNEIVALNLVTNTQTKIVSGLPYLIMSIAVDDRDTLYVALSTRGGGHLIDKYDSNGNRLGTFLALRPESPIADMVFVGALPEPGVCTMLAPMACALALWRSVGKHTRRNANAVPVEAQWAPSDP